MKTVERRTLNSTLFGFIQFGLTFIQSILLVPLLLSHWGKEKYGIYIAVFAFLQLLRIIDFGHQTFVGNEFNKEYFIDQAKARAILASSLKIAFVLGGIELVLFLLFWLSRTVYPIMGLDQFESSFVMFGILSMILMWWLVGSAGGVFSRALLTKGLYAEVLLWAIGLKILEIFFLIIAAIVNMSLFNLLWIWAIINILYTAVVIRWSMKILIDFRTIFTISDWKLGFRGLKKSFVLIFNNGLEQFNLNGIIFLITRLVSLAVLPIFVTTRTLTNTVVQFTGLIVSPLQPELIRYHSERSGLKIASVIKTVWIINGFLVNVSLLAITPFIAWVYTFWTKGILTFDRNLFFLLCLSTSIANFGKIVIAYLTGINDLKSITILSVTRFVILFVISLLLIKTYGLTAIGIGFILAEIVSSVVLPLYLTMDKLKKFGSELHAYDIVLGLVPIFILGFCFWLEYILDAHLWMIAIIGVTVMTVVYFIQWKRMHIEVRYKLETLTVLIIKRGRNIILMKRKLM